MTILSDIKLGKITMASEIRKLVEFHSKTGKFQPFAKERMSMTLVASGDSSDGKDKPRSCFQFLKSGSCSNGDSCRYVHSSNGGNTSSASGEAHAKPSESTVLQNHPKLSPSDAKKVENITAKTKELQAYLSGAATVSYTHLTLPTNREV